MKFSIITNCSSRKRDIGVAPLMPTVSPDITINELVKTWVAQVQQSQVRVAPWDLYQGRSFSECRVVTRLTGAEFYVISAGLGLVHSNDLLPNYSLTVSEGSGSLQKWLQSQSGNSAHWWTALCQGMGSPAPLSALINSQDPNSRHLIALPSGYLEMVAHDLECVNDSRLQTLRIFTSEAGSKSLHAKLRSVVMPYDERLEGVDNHKGTRSDFPQRALKHFVANLKGHELTLDRGKDAVNAAMALAIKPTIPSREKAPDERIAELIRTHWHHHEGSASKLLRFLRDDAKVACEQSRFSGIWRKVKEGQLARGSLHV
jgi:hypothetical protein